MRPTDRDLLCEAIRRTVAQRTGEAYAGGSSAGATLGTWQQLASRLSPVIGQRGVEVLFGRAAHLTTVAYPWVDAAAEHRVPVVPPAAFSARLEAREATAAAEASRAFLTTFTGLLEALIGKPLSDRLLAPVQEPIELASPGLGRGSA
jgi:hypothetical protein